MSMSRTILFLTVVLELGFLFGVLAGRAEAACTCICIEGKPRAQCPSVLETATCPPSVCSAASKPASPPIMRPENCQLVQVQDPATGRVERKRICK
jgi:hypothetical protein